MFLGPVAGILLSDYHVVRRRQLDIDALYSAKRGAVYWFTGGWNPEALVALAAGAAPTFPGLLNSLFGWPVPQLCVHLYSASWLVGFTVSAVVYAVLMRRQAAGAAAGAAA